VCPHQPCFLATVFRMSCAHVRVPAQQTSTSLAGAGNHLRARDLGALAALYLQRPLHRTTLYRRAALLRVQRGRSGGRFHLFMGQPSVVRPPTGTTAHCASSSSTDCSRVAWCGALPCSHPLLCWRGQINPHAAAARDGAGASAYTSTCGALPSLPTLAVLRISHTRNAGLCVFQAACGSYSAPGLRVF